VQGNFAEIKQIENKAWIFLILAGIATTLSTVFSYKALSLGPAAYVTTVERLSLVIAVILSIIFLKQKITWQLIVGISVIIAGAVLIALSDSGAK
jgi:transporter family protein